MKTIFAKEKSEYLHCLTNVINYNLTPEFRHNAYRRMQELETIVKNQGDELAIIVTTINTNTRKTAPPMTKEDIAK